MTYSHSNLSRMTQVSRELYCAVLDYTVLLSNVLYCAVLNSTSPFVLNRKFNVLHIFGAPNPSKARTRWN